MTVVVLFYCFTESLSNTYFWLFIFDILYGICFS